MCSLLLLSPAAERWIHTSPKTALWYRNSCYMTVAECPPAYLGASLCVRSCLSLCASEQVYLSARGGRVLSSVSPNSGRGPGGRAAIVCQSDGLPCPPPSLRTPPTVWGPVLLLSHAVILNSFHLYLCSSRNPSIVIIYSLRNLYWLKSFFFFFNQGPATQFRGSKLHVFKNVAFRQDFWHLSFLKTRGLA